MSDLVVVAIVAPSVIAYLAIAVALAASWAPHVGDFNRPMAYIASILWPVILAPVVAFIINERHRDRDFIEARVATRLRQEHHQRDQRIRELETQLGIHDEPKHGDRP